MHMLVYECAAVHGIVYKERSFVEWSPRDKAAATHPCTGFDL